MIMDLLIIADADDRVLPGHDHCSVDGVRVPIQLAQKVRMLTSRYHRGHGFLPLFPTRDKISTNGSRDNHMTLQIGKKKIPAPAGVGAMAPIHGTQRT